MRDHPVAWTQAGVCLPHQSLLLQSSSSSSAVPMLWKLSQCCAYAMGIVAIPFLSTKAMLCRSIPLQTHTPYIITNTIINNAEEALAMDLILLSPRAWPSIAFADAEVLIETEVEPQKLIR